MISLSNPRNVWMRGASTVLRLYLIAIISGCAPPTPVPVTEARAMETRILAAHSDRVVKASINVLQDLHFTIDMLNSDVGVIVASRHTEIEQGDITQEDRIVSNIPTWQKVLGVGIILAIIGGIALLFSGRGGSDKSSGRGDDSEHFYIHDDRDGWEETVYQYKVTVNVESISGGESRLRVSAQGERLEGGRVVGAGPVQDPEFFQQFFASLDKALFLQN
ncbi:MAG: hypothetical protein QF613_04210 [Candidatus Marinimicrobia bacterium]|nr:hypothetical protein [Candidatus Neomarinimicrobiota bacterium]